MSNSISSSFPAAALAANYSTNAEPAQQSQQTANTSADTVKLTESQQVHQLYKQGQKVAQIATRLSLPVDIVNSYLGITDTTG
ncbi:MAG: hypothetical protein WCA16_18440 [Candidatus Sulfotelmatobacter sp.]